MVDERIGCTDADAKAALWPQPTATIELREAQQEERAGRRRHHDAQSNGAISSDAGRKSQPVVPAVLAVELRIFERPSPNPRNPVGTVHSQFTGGNRWPTTVDAAEPIAIERPIESYEPVEPDEPDEPIEPTIDAGTGTPVRQIPIQQEKLMTILRRVRFFLSFF